MRLGWRCVLMVAIAGCGQPEPAFLDEGLMVCAKGPTIEGVDVSHYDGAIDWAKAHGAGIDFTFMKATEGTTFVDPTFATNWKGAGDNGVIRGAYHFFRPADDAAMQADFFVQTAGVPAAGNLPLTLDLEATDNLPAATVAQQSLAFLQRVEQLTGRPPIIYTSASFFNGTLGGPKGFDGYPLWVAHWTNNCPNVPDPTWSDWLFWQYTDQGTVAGIPSMVDRNKFNGTLANLQNFVSPPSATDGSGPLDAGSTDAAASAVDAASRATDAAMSASLDAPTTVGSPSGCACDLAARRGGPPPGALLLLLALAGALLRRKTVARQHRAQIGRGGGR